MKRKGTTKIDYELYELGTKTHLAGVIWGANLILLQFRFYLPLTLVSYPTASTAAQNFLI